LAPVPARVLPSVSVRLSVSKRPVPPPSALLRLRIPVLLSTSMQARLPVLLPALL
jgi:hypothetical protein